VMGSRTEYDPRYPGMDVTISSMRSMVCPYSGWASSRRRERNTT